MKVFISHNSNDKDIAETIGSWLNTNGCEVWLDKWSMTPGDSLIEKIGEGIDNSDKLIVLLSPNSVDSNWVKREVATGLVLELAEEKGLGDKFVIPILIAKCEIPIMLRDKLYADYTNKTFDAACQELLSGIRNRPLGSSDQKFENRIVNYYKVHPKFGTKYALLVEFGVRMTPTAGINLGIDVGSNYKLIYRWFGKSNNPEVPENMSFVAFSFSEEKTPPVYLAKFESPKIESSKSLYLYFESDEQFEIRNIQYLDFYDCEP